MQKPNMIKYRGALYAKADQNYRGVHEAPGRDYGASLDNPTDMFPDIYSSMGNQIYRTRHVCDSTSMRAINAARGNPDYVVTVYRAVPTGVNAQLNPGDWVTICRQYAEDHGESWIKEGYEILSQEVRAGDLFSEGNSIHEWGYDPE